MIPIKFREQNVVYAENQKPYLPLPSYKDNDSWECVTSCWGLGFKERIKILFTGKVWVTMPTFGKPLTPVMVEIDKPEMKSNDRLEAEKE